MQSYIAKKPDEETAIKFLGSKLQQEDNATQIKEILETLKENKKVEKLIWQYYYQIQQQFK